MTNLLSLGHVRPVSIRPPPPRRQHGFTLIEAVMVIVITGIIGGIVAIFIRAPVQNYVNSTARAELTDMADLTLRRITRELRLAVPNSIRVSGNSLEFLLVKTGGRYLAAGEWPNAVAPVPPPLDFANHNTAFTVVGTMPTDRQAIRPGSDSIVVYNTNVDDAYSGVNRALITGVDVISKTVTIANNPLTSAFESQANRFLVITTPVTYSCNNNSIARSSNYNITPVQNPTPGGTVALLSNNVTACAFSVANLANVRVALVGVSITMQAPGGADPAITLAHQIHVGNAP